MACATAGAINIISRDPGDGPVGYATLTARLETMIWSDSRGRGWSPFEYGIRKDSRHVDPIAVDMAGILDMVRMSKPVVRLMMTMNAR